MRAVILAISSLLLFIGCAHKVQVNALQPAEIDSAAKIKTIAVYPFKSDSVGFSSKIETALASKRIEGKSYFTIVSRHDIERIFQEQRLQNSGLLDETTSVEVGSLLGAQAHISGVINVAEATDRYYKEKRQKCVDDKCKEMITYTVSCTSRAFHLSVQLNMVDIEKGDLIYSDAQNERKLWRTCSDSNYPLPSKSRGLEMLALNVAQKFAGKLTPFYYAFDVVLLDEPDIDYSDDDKKILENAIIYIDHKRYTKAEYLLSRLLNNTQEKSYVAAYNLGVVKEIQGELVEAGQLYTLADGLTIEPVEEIDSAMVRIKSSLKNRSMAQRQMQR
jgi:tetratricopeptide (TPR) repeat protein